MALIYLGWILCCDICMSWYAFIKYEIKWDLVMLSMKWKTWLEWLRWHVEIVGKRVSSETLSDGG